MRPSIRLALTLTTGIGLVLPAMRAGHAQDASSGPPARVGQIALVRGSVSFSGSASGSASGSSGDTSQWTQAALNYPITGGDALYTEPGAEAAVAIDWSRITLGAATELQITRIGSRTVDAALSQGEAFLDLRYLRPGDAYVITTPRGTVNITRNGRYDILAGDQNAPTMVTVLNGAAQLQGQAVSLAIGPGETATLQGADPVNASLGGERRDPFLIRMLRVRYAAPPSYVPPVVNQMTGGYQLSQYGAWSRSPQYGAVWYPRVASNWVPYRDGHWAYVAPWGWTWVDNDPWGFAPFHYGRWVQYGGRWGWAPAPVAYAAPAYYQPVYAPALVSFFNVGSGVAIGVGITAGAFAAGSIGWVPLAPQEPYLPWYHAPQQYVRNINYYNVRNVNRYTNINNTTIVNNYGPARLINRGGATVIPAAAMRRGDPVARFGRPAPQMVLAAARPVPPAGFRGPPPGPGPAGGAGPVRPPGGPGPHPAPGFGRLPGAPGGLVHPIAAPAPRPAPFAAARGLPVGHPGPIQRAVMRPAMHVVPHGFQPGAVPGQPAARPMPGRPMPAHPVPAAIGRPMTPAGVVHPGAAPPPRAPGAPLHPPVRPQLHPPAPQARQLPQAHQLPRVRPVPQMHPVPQAHPAQPVQQRPQVHPPVQQFHPAQAMRPAPPLRPAPIARPAPQFHPPVQQARPVQQFHPAPIARPAPQFHPPVQQVRPVQQVHPAPIARPAPRPQQRPAAPQFHPAPQPRPPGRPSPRPNPGQKDVQHP